VFKYKEIFCNQKQVLVHGRNVFMGYLRNNQKTASEFMDDGWLKSGDLGYIDKVDN